MSFICNYLAKVLFCTDDIINAHLYKKVYICTSVISCLKYKLLYYSVQYSVPTYTPVPGDFTQMFEKKCHNNHNIDDNTVLLILQILKT